MKTYLFIFAILLAPVALFAQTDNEVDTNYFNLGKKQVEIIERDDSTFVRVWEEDEDNEILKLKGENNDGGKWDFSFSENKRRFRGHWAGFEFGMNNYVDDNFSLQRTDQDEFMDVNRGRSWNFNLNFAQYSIPTIGIFSGFVLGMGIEWSNYHFANASTIYKSTDTRQIEPLDINSDLKLNRFQTTYLTIPLFYEVQFFNGSRHDKMFISAGIVGGIKLASHTKYKYIEDGDKKVEKNRDDFYLRPFRYGFTARVGYKMIKLYANYYPVSLFLDDRGPELYPVAMGFSLIF